MKLTYRDRKSVLRLLRVLSPLAFILLCAAPPWNIMNNNSSASADTESVVDTGNKDVKELVDPDNDFNYEGSDYLQKNAVPEINDLVNRYYTAQLALDMDTLESLVSDVDRINQSKLQAQLEYMESIDNIVCYTVQGELEGTYRVYVYYDMKIRGIDTLAPALSALYVTMSSDGGYIVYLSELDGETQEFIKETDASEDVVTLKALVQERFQTVVSSDDKLKDFCEMLGQNEGDSDGADSSAVTEQAVDAQ